MSSHYSILEFWENKMICKDGRIINEWERNKLGFDEAIPIVKDSGEPMCWACSRPVVGNYEKLHNGAYDKHEIKALYSDKKVVSGLNKCHIVPASLGGCDKSDNLFLMCETCHNLSPDSTNESSFFRWVYRQRKRMVMGLTRIDLIMNDVDVELECRGLIPFAEIVALCPDIKTDKINEYMKERISSQAGKISHSTIISAIADWYEYHYLKKYCVTVRGD